MSNNSVRLIALRDMAAAMAEDGISVHAYKGEVWVVSASRVDNPTTQRLNAELGINKVNYINNVNGVKNKDNS